MTLGMKRIPGMKRTKNSHSHRQALRREALLKTLSVLKSLSESLLRLLN